MGRSAEPRLEPEPVGEKKVNLEGSEGSEAETVKELMGRLEERVRRELLCWCMRHDIRPTDRVLSLMSPEPALHTRLEVCASRLVKTVPAPRTRPPVRLPSPARPVPALRSRPPVHLHSPVSPAPALRTVSPVHCDSLVRPTFSGAPTVEMSELQ